MGGAPSPKTVMWRGYRFDPDTAAMLTRVAADVGDDIYVRPIQGSYSAGTAASAGTHDGGGAYDLDCEGLTDAQARRLETECRKKGSAAWFRPRYSPSGAKYKWQRHVHGLRLDCPDLSVSARVQCVAYFAGLSGLAGGAKDTGSRAYVDARWLKIAAAPAPIAPVQEDDIMASISDLEKVIDSRVQKIVDAILWADVIPGQKGSVRNSIHNADINATYAHEWAKRCAGLVTADTATITAAIAALPVGTPVTAEHLAAALLDQIAKAAG